MKVRRAKDLLQLSGDEFFEAVSQGFCLIVENASRLYVASETLFISRYFQGAKILDMLADEESAKCLILIDAVRCPPMFPERGRHLGYFHNHLARGIYARLAGARPTDLGELQKDADHYRRTLYLDGPNDVDWIFRNEIEAEREEAMYVDYVETDDGHEWLAPRNDEILMPWCIVEPPALKISKALHRTGITSPEGLAIIAEVWRPMHVDLNLRWDLVEAKNRECLTLIERKGFLRADCKYERQYAIQQWPFPLYTLDLSPKKIDRNYLQQVQDSLLSGQVP